MMIPTSVDWNEPPIQALKGPQKVYKSQIKDYILYADAPNRTLGSCVLATNSWALFLPVFSQSDNALASFYLQISDEQLSSINAFSLPTLRCCLSW